MNLATARSVKTRERSRYTQNGRRTPVFADFAIYRRGPYCLHFFGSYHIAGSCKIIIASL